MSTKKTEHVRVASPDGRFIALAGPENTVLLVEASSGACHGRYFGHQDGVYGRRSNRILTISWEQDPCYGLVVISASSSGSIQRWEPLHCTHISTIRSVQACMSLCMESR